MVFYLLTSAPPPGNVRRIVTRPPRTPGSARSPAAGSQVGDEHAASAVALDAAATVLPGADQLRASCRRAAGATSSDVAIAVVVAQRDERGGRPGVAAPRPRRPRRRRRAARPGGAFRGDRRPGSRDRKPAVPAGPGCAAAPRDRADPRARRRARCGRTASPWRAAPRCACSRAIFSASSVARRRSGGRWGSASRPSRAILTSSSRSRMTVCPTTTSASRWKVMSRGPMKVS